MKRATSAAAIILLLGCTWLANSADIGVWVYVLVLASVMGPVATYFWWFYARHAPAFGASDSLDLSVLLGAMWFVASAVVISAATLALLRTFGGSAVGLLVVLAASLGVSWVVLRGPWINDRHVEMPVEDQTAFRALAEWVGVTCEFVFEKPMPLAGPNARAERGRRKDFVVVSPGLLDESAELQSLVVAHEVSHLKNGHHLKLQGLAVARAVVWVVGMWAVFGLSGEQFYEAANFPLWVLVSLLVLVPPTLAMNFVARHFERQADADSYELLGSVPTELARELYARRLTDLDPGLISRAFSAHPPPAERLEVVSRRIPSL